MNDRRLPKLRFKGFKDDWEQRKLGDVLRTLPFKQFLKTPEQGGKYEIIQQGNEPIIGYANGEPCESFRNTVIFGDHTLSLYKPKKPFFVATDGVRILQGTNDMDGYYLLSLLEGNSLKSEGYKRYYSILLDREVLLTENHCEQVQIGLCFKHFDHLITLHQRKLEKLKIVKKAMLENCFPKNGEKVPRFRFSGFTGDWEQRKVGQLTNVLSASRVHKEEWAEDGVPFFRSSDVVSAFKGTENEKAFISVELYEQLAKSSGKLEKNDILITGGGSIGIPYIMPDNKPLYSKDADLIWIKHSANFDSIYLYTYFMSEEFREYLASISHTGTIAHYTIEQVKDTPVRLPSIDEQRKLGNFFVSLDHLITLHQRKLEKLKIIKKSFLEKMFV